MPRHAVLVSAAFFALSLSACSDGECRCVGPGLDAGDGSPASEVDAGVCGEPPLQLPVCGEPLTRTGVSLGRNGVSNGPATVTGLSVGSDGAFELGVQQEDATHTLQLPTDPGLMMNDAVDLVIDDAGVAVFHDGGFVAYEGGSVDIGELHQALLDAAANGDADLSLGPIDASVEPLCATVQPHHSHFCEDVGMVSFGLVFGEIPVAPGEQVELEHGGRQLTVLNRNIALRDDRYAESCSTCGDLWHPSLDVAIVARPAP